MAFSSPVLLAISALFGALTSGIGAWNLTRTRQQGNTATVLGIYDKLVTTLNTELQRRDARILELERELSDLQRRRGRTP